MITVFNTNKNFKSSTIKKLGITDKQVQVVVTIV
jgi:hypothetical protein